MKDVCAVFISSCDEKLRDGRLSVGRHRIVVREIEKCIAPHFGTIKIADLTVEHIAAFYKSMLDSGRVNPITARGRISVLRQIEDYAIAREYTKKSVCPAALRELRGIKRVEQKHFSPEEAIHVLRCSATKRKLMAERNFRMTQCFVALAALCGMRYSEILCLRPENINFRIGAIHIRNSLSGSDMIGPTKTADGVRDVPTPSYLEGLLSDWMSTHLRPEPRGLIFRTETGLRVHPGRFHEWNWHPLLKQAGLYVKGGDNFHFHSLRAFAVSWWGQNGVPIKTAQKWMGHSDARMTLDVYARSLTTVEQERGTAEQLAEKLFGGATPLGLPPAIAAE